MAFYLKSRKIDMETGNPLVVVLNEVDAKEQGLSATDRVWITSHDRAWSGIVNISATEVNEGEIGLFTDVWDTYKIPAGEYVSIDVITNPKSVEYIAKKLQGKRLSEEEMTVIMKDIGDRKVREAEMAYFMATMFNPGFDDDEAYYATKAMANSGEKLDFTAMAKDGIVIDKHSIGGIAGKGVTPIIVPIIAANGLCIPNTQSRSITSPAGTTDVLESVMPIELQPEAIYDVVKKTNGCFVWGGGLKLGPADDELITVEKGLHVQSYQKFIISILAKKVATGLTHILIDLPYGRETKIEKVDDIDLVSDTFVKLAGRLGIKCVTYRRLVKGPDGFGVGPILEMIDILRLLERKPGYPVHLEKLVIDMAGKVLELGNAATEGKGAELARETIESGRALEKFWEIATVQGAQKRVVSEELVPGDVIHEVFAPQSGLISFISYRSVVNIARALGTPIIQQAGLHFEKLEGESVEKGDKILTLHATSENRMQEALEQLDVDKLFEIS